MEELVRWLGEQLDKDERIVRAADDTLGKMHLDWRYQPEDPAGGRIVSARGADLIPDVTTGVGAHVAEYDPRRMLREIDATRVLLTQYEGLKGGMPDDMTGVVALETAIRAKAAVYDQRPGYREEWRP